MATPFTQEQPTVTGGEREKKMVEVAGAGSATEAIGGAAAVVLSIIGLAGALSSAMMETGTIVLGAALLFDAGAIAARYERLCRTAWGEQSHAASFSSGISAESVAGLTAIVLGILALLGMAPVTLCSVALIVLGAALLFASAAKSRFTSVSTSQYGVSDRARQVLDEATNLTAGSDVLIGIGAVVLGILALLGIQSTTLVLVGYLGIGFATMMGGSAGGARMRALLRHART